MKERCIWAGVARDINSTSGYDMRRLESECVRCDGHKVGCPKKIVIKDVRTQKSK